VAGHGFRGYYRPDADRYERWGHLKCGVRCPLFFPIEGPKCIYRPSC
jgi:hypothetical protein